MAKLPMEVFMNVVGFIDSPRDKIRLGLVCKRYKVAIDESVVWPGKIKIDMKTVERVGQ